jgi:hypothetical protein
VRRARCAAKREGCRPAAPVRGGRVRAGSRGGREEMGVSGLGGGEERGSGFVSGLGGVIEKLQLGRQAFFPKTTAPSPWPWDQDPTLHVRVSIICTCGPVCT